MESNMWVLEPKESSKINRRRRMHQERAIRINNPYYTSIAVDKQALEEQVQEQKLLKYSAMKQEEDYNLQLMKVDSLAQQKERQLLKEKQQRKTDLMHYWQMQREREQQIVKAQQLKLKQENPYQLSFVGEDPLQKVREVTQKKEFSEGLILQMTEKSRLMREEHEKRMAEEQRLQEVADHCRQVAEAEELCREAEKLALTSINVQIAKENFERQKREKVKRMKEERIHVENAIRGTFLTEDPDVAISRLGADKVICHRWKGLTQEQRRRQYDELVQQMREKEILKQKKKTEDMMWQNCLETQNNYSDITQRQLSNEKKLKEENTKQMNRELARLQKNQRDEEKKMYDYNQPSEEYFGNFGVYHR